MIKAAIIFGVVSLVPLITALTRFKAKADDNEMQKAIKMNMKHTQFGIATLFLIAALLLFILSFVFQDGAIATGVMTGIYIVALVSSIGYAVFRQMKLQKYLREKMVR